MRTKLQLLALSCTAASAVLLLASPARADTAAAEARFREGLQLMDQKDYSAACPKLAESNRLDPASGTLLALALCHERAGKTASAWAAYTDAAARAKLEKRADREKAAKQKIADLEPKLSKLTLRVSDQARGTSGFSLKRDGEPVGEGSWDSPTPVDPGEHEIEASAPGHESFKVSVTVGADGDQKTIEIAALEKLAEGVVTPVASSSSSASADTSTSGGSLRTVGLIAGGVGVVALGVGTYFGLQAKSKNSDSSDDCDGNVCGDSGYAARQDARSAGNTATIAFVAGGVLVATGVTLYVLGAPSKGREASARPSVQLVPALAPTAAGGFVRGVF